MNIRNLSRFAMGSKESALKGVASQNGKTYRTPGFISGRI